MRKTAGRLYKRGHVFWVRWGYKGRMFRQTTGKTALKDAKAEMEKLLAPYQLRDAAAIRRSLAATADLAEEQALLLEEARHPPLSLDDAWSAYLRNHTRPDSGPRTLHDYEGYWRAFVRWLRSRDAQLLLLRDVTPFIASEYALHLTRGLNRSAGTSNRTINFLRMFFRIVGEEGRVPANPFGGIQRRKGIAQSRRLLTLEEVRRLIETADGEWKTLMMIGAFTGFRLGDACTLRWEETDPDRGVITRIPRKTSRTSGVPVVVGIPRILLARLSETPRAGRRGPVMPSVARQYETSQPTLCKQVIALFDKAKIPVLREGTGKAGNTGKDDTTGGREKAKPRGAKPDAPRPRGVVETGFHSLRYWFLSAAAAGGASETVLRKLAGHTSARMAFHYLVADEAVARQTALTLPNVIEEPNVGGVEAPKFVDHETVRQLAEDLKETTWHDVRQQLLALEGRTLAHLAEDRDRQPANVTKKGASPNESE